MRSSNVDRLTTYVLLSAMLLCGHVSPQQSDVTEERNDVRTEVPLSANEEFLHIGHKMRTEAYRLATARQYVILAPRRVRPDVTYHTHITINEIGASNMTVRAILTVGGEEYSSGQVRFTSEGTKSLLLKIPVGVVSGKHVFTVEGVIGTDTAFPAFREHRELEFVPKYRSIFVQTDKPVYYPPQKIHYRVVGLTPDLMAASGAMTIYLQDAQGNLVIRNLMQQLTFGQFQGEFELSYPVNVGTWHIVVEAFGYKYEHPIEVIWYWFRRYEVNVTAPLYVMDTQPVYRASVYGEHMSKKEAYGNATTVLRCHTADGDFLPGNITIHIPYMKGVHHIEIAMIDIKKKWGEYLDGHTLYLESWLYNWELVETQNGTARTKIHMDGVKLRRLGNSYITFHPGKPFTVFIAVLRSDGTPYQNHTHRWLDIEVVHEGSDGGSYKERVVLPDDGIVKYSITPKTTDQKIAILATHENSSSSVLTEAYRYYSMNGYYIAVMSSTKTPKTNEYMIFTVRTNFFAADINYVIMSKGQILVSSKLSMYSQQKTFSVSISRQMLPHARIIVYCVVKDSVLMDGINFHVQDSLLMTSSLVKNRGKDFSFDTIETIGRGPVGSFMSLSGHHYEWSRRGASTFLTEERIMRDLLTYAQGDTAPHHHIWFRNDTRWDEDVFFPSESLGMEGNSTLAGAGLLVVTDMKLSFAHGDDLVCNISHGLGQCPDGTCFELSRKCDGFLDCPDGFDEAGCPDLIPPVPRPNEALSLAPFATYYDDALWTFKTSYVKPNLGGQVEVALNPPELKDIYMFHAFFMHPEYGLSIAREPITHNLTRWFFMRCESPEQLRRGEQVGIRCALFNKWPQYLEVMVVLHGGPTFRFINVEDNGIVSSYSPRLSAGDVQVMVSLFPGEERYIYWPIQPIVVKDIVELTVSSWSTIHKDQETLSFEIFYDGCVNEDYTPYLIDLINKPSVYTPYLDTAIPAQWSIPGQRDHIYIPGSPIGTVSVWGGVSTSGFFVDHFDADLAAGLPHDQLEGYTFDFAFNLLVMQYMQDLNRLDEPTKKKVLSYMQTIIMRQYSYMGPDGSFKMFRRAETPCLWCTSLVLYYMHDFFITEWAEEVFIPVEILNRIALWLTDQQNEDGAFVETTEHIYNRHFWPNATDEDGVNHTWHIPTTAHATITLAKAVRLTDEAKSKAASAIRLASEYLAAKIPHITDPFQMAITAYALDKTGHPMKDTAFYKLKTMRREDRNIYWSPQYIRPNDIKVVDNKHIILPRDDFITLGNAAMATSYALMLYLNHGEFEASRPIMAWLNDQHMDLFVVAGCVDTLLAHEALMQFAKRETNHQFYNMKITITAPSSPGWSETVHINSSNFPAFTQFQMPEVWGTIAAHSEGTGYAQISVFAEHMVEKPRQVATSAYPTFDWVIGETEYSGRNASIMKMNLCLRWLRPDIAPVSGMGNIWMDIPSGFVMDRDEIERIYRENTAHIKRVRFRQQTLWVFFETIPTYDACWSFTFRRWYPISNSTVSHFLGIYEYSETALFHFVGYSTYTLFHLHACQVCASYQCPYCPWYNSATCATPSFCVMIACVLLLISSKELLLENWCSHIPSHTNSTKKL